MIMKQTIKDKRLAVLEDMVKYYSKAPVSRRCYDKESRNCKYHPDTVNKPKSEGCAVGRMLPRALAKKLDNRTAPPGVGTVFRLHKAGEIKLSKKVLALGKGFLSDLQFLHDADDVWTSRGLSDSGKNKVKKIKGRIEEGWYSIDI